MESLGNYLYETRTKLNIPLGQIARDTNIAKKYLEALEIEDYSIFPSETYLRGFLKAYSEYLKLNPVEILKIYENIKIAETPPPLEKLIPKRKMNYRPILTVSSLVFILVFAVIFGSFITKKITSISKDITTSEKIKNKKSKESQTYTIRKDDPEQIFNFKKDDVIEYISDNEKFKLKIKELTPVVKVLTNESANTEIILIKSFPVKIDLNNDNNFDLVLYLNQWDSDKANITIRNKDIKNEDVITAMTDTKTTIQGFAPEVITKITEKSKIDFSVDITAPGFFRYKSDNNQEFEKFYNDNSKNNITALDKVILWASNAGNVVLNFQNYNKTIRLGETGEIAVKIIQWRQNSGGEYELEISNLN